MSRLLHEIAYARSGDKGSNANIGVIARDPASYELLLKLLTAERVAAYFKGLNPGKVIRYELPNLHALNFVLEGVLDGGGSRSLRLDSQGKALAQALLLMEIPHDEPNARTQKAMRDVDQRKNLTRCNSIEEFWKAVEIEPTA